MNGIWLERSAVALTMYFLARTVGRYRGSKTQQAALRTPLVDAAVLEAAFHPRLKDGDDPDLLAELRDTFAHLNRQAWAEEFWDLHTQIAALAGALGPAQNATLRRVVLRLLTSDDRWLQAVAAKTAADLGMTEAVSPLTALLQREPTGTGDLEVRFRLVLEDALTTLTGAVPQA
jgi:hypothetical protein